MCWYTHIAFANSIDILIDKEFITMPEQIFCSIVLYKEGLEGILVGL
jgi:hypothetical protein